MSEIVLDTRGAIHRGVQIQKSNVKALTVNFHLMHFNAAVVEMLMSPSGKQFHERGR
jgi:hypothetical protein